jgi:hemoglobin
VKAQDPATTDLVQDLGGRDALDQIVEDFYLRVQSDPMLARFFAATDVTELVAMQQSFLAAALSGCADQADTTLQLAHAGRDIAPRHFSRFVELFLDTLDDRFVDPDTVALVGQRLGLYLDDITGDVAEAG